MVLFGSADQVDAIKRTTTPATGVMTDNACASWSWGNVDVGGFFFLRADLATGVGGVKVERPQRSGRVAGGSCTPRLPQIPA
jgi:hypothetical protein